MSTKSIFDLIEEGKIKRYFRVDKKLIVENGVYHITQRAPGREKIFLEESDYLFFLKLLKEIVSIFKLELFAFALLPNHLHLLLQIKEKNLSQAMKALLGRYAIVFNKKYKRKGHVFGGRYRAALCNDDIYLLAISFYIHLNPFKAGLINVIENYKWCSLLPYIYNIKKNPFINYRFILRMLDNDIFKAKDIYRDLLHKSSTIIYPNVLVQSNTIQRFVSEIVNFVKDINLSMCSEIIRLNESLEFLRGKRRLREPKEKQARQYLIDQLRARGCMDKEICEVLDMSRQALFKIKKGM